MLKSKKSQNIAFVTGTFGHGRGGHFWDLITVAESLNLTRDVVIFNISRKNSPVLDESSVNVVNIRANLLQSIILFRKYVLEMNITAIFSFDIRVAFFPSFISNLLQVPLIYIKPGGPNPTKKYPKVRDLIVYSKENYNYFERDNIDGYINLYLIPNRSVKVTTDWLLVNELKARLEAGCFNFVQVIRITPEYYQNLTQSINLIKKLNEKSERKVGLVIIGVIQDVGVYEKIKKEAESLPVHIITDNKFTECASKLLEIGDAVIGNGRSVMEAASLGLPVLVSAQNSSHPVLLNKHNFENAFEVNFSPRYKIASPEDDKHFDNIKMLVKNEIYLIENKEHSKTCFDVHFNVFSIIEQYLSIAENAKHKKMPLMVLLNLLKTYVASCARARYSK